MQTSITDVLITYAASMIATSSGDTPLAAAQRQGWLDAAGEPTPDGREAAKAFLDQERTRSAFRIG